MALARTVARVVGSPLLPMRVCRLVERSDHGDIAREERADRQRNRIHDGDGAISLMFQAKGMPQFMQQAPITICF